MQQLYNTYEYNTNTFRNYIKGHFYKQQSKTYIFVIIEYDNYNPSPYKCLQVLIDFIPEEYIEYEFEVVNATSSFLHLKYFGYDYYIDIIQLEQKNNEKNNNQIKVYTNEIKNINNSLSNLDNELDYNIDDELDGYDSEGYFFRPKRW
jgi:hypothetical protein